VSSNDPSPVRRGVNVCSTVDPQQFAVCRGHVSCVSLRNARSVCSRELDSRSNVRNLPVGAVVVKESRVEIGRVCDGTLSVSGLEAVDYQQRRSTRDDLAASWPDPVLRIRAWRTLDGRLYASRRCVSPPLNGTWLSRSISNQFPVFDAGSSRCDGRRSSGELLISSRLHGIDFMALCGPQCLTRR
jgi:hypothetical protein